jgi:transcriptional regulator with XRE-family HTH domain
MRNTNEVGDEAQVGLRVCESLANIRKLSRIGQAEVARRLGVTRAHISALERGTVTQVPFTTLVAWARVLGVELDIRFTAKES